MKPTSPSPRPRVAGHPALRCAVLRHEGVASPHFDVLFETSPGAALATWRAERWPPEAGDYVEGAPDHRPAYLTYEGPISGGRGEVRRVFADTCRSVRLVDGLLEVTFSDGTELTLIKDGPDQWLVAYNPAPAPYGP